MAKRSDILIKGQHRTCKLVHIMVILLFLLSVHPVMGEEQPKRTSLFNQDWLKSLSR